MEKVDLSKGYWNPQRKLGVATHFYENINIVRTKLLTWANFPKKKDEIFCKEFLWIRLDIPKKQSHKIFKLHDNWKHKNHSRYVCNPDKLKEFSSILTTFTVPVTLFPLSSPEVKHLRHSHLFCARTTPSAGACLQFFYLNILTIVCPKSI